MAVAAGELVRSAAGEVRAGRFRVCSTCATSEGGFTEALTSLGVSAPKYPKSYLAMCRNCSALWMGHGYEPQFMLELSQADASEIFPNWECTLRVVG